ncbi:MAG TPA: prepilin-type N-terminal cleavage/methylation domain-containing protein [Gallionellaceae bacterium]|nr:prepilin-type N-terminal cleavage/methylation domain-containing protein [Gallionellaceae bacterium]
MKQKQSGFTLIEIAIVLVIIGLLLGGVLKGQELINSARVKNLANDFRNIPLFLYGYQDRYRGLPGDQTQAALNTQFPPNGTATASTTVATLGNGVINGNWNDLGTASESYVFWQHVRIAGFAPGVTAIPAAPAHGDGYLPVNAVGGEIGIQSGTTDPLTTPINAVAGANPIRGSYIICSSGILGRFVVQLDNTMDDNNTATGSMMAGIATPAGTPMTAVANGAIDPAASYTVCMGI